MFDYAAGKADWLACGLESEGEMASEPRAGTLAERTILSCDLNDDPRDLLRRMEAAGSETCVVVNANRTVLGMLSLTDLKTPGEGTIEQRMAPGPSTFRANVSLEEMVHYMHEHEIEDALITTSDGVLIGNLSRREAERFLEEHSGHEKGTSRQRGGRD